MKVFGTDYDGVIINIEPQKALAFGELLNREWQINKREASNFWMGSGGTSRRSKFDYFYEKQFHKELIDEEYRSIADKFKNNLFKDFYPSVRLLDGALELLKFCKNNFDHRFISSGMPMQEIKDLVTMNGVSNYFEKIFGTDVIYKSKEEHFAEINNFWKPSEIIFVADAEEDMRVAKKFDAFAIGLTTNIDGERLLSAGANEIADNLHTVLEIIRKV
ncbi:MAG: HAD family hydrolase [uncultured bacterium]|nr:MAG: HAD family hydrolase [uncultured bacterium]KKP95121.1 MAG: hypothetical protein US02_C0013G0007 [Candidatus Levybacteria bacterium GW2011_GWA2_36_13]KKP99954.1 MAG: hypothetical protein US07_C0016G0007 [Candidatus Levybacteria bacterium GW2011_GWB1_36_18]KKQ57962.1 MAG: hypothetical protein US77_C0013G0007 [Microgenomates group bacterium GW2011_GWC1_38_14]OGH10140.1 MAG: hypothetical protein A2152_01215 [Candidatus Levybacteria bacterium RBG_16_35_6]